MLAMADDPATRPECPETLALECPAARPLGVPGPDAGRLDPPAPPLRSASRGPAPAPRSRCALGASRDPRARCWLRNGRGASRLARKPPGCRCQPEPPACGPRPRAGLGWAAAVRPPPPHRKCPSAARSPRWLAPRPL